MNRLFTFPDTETPLRFRVALAALVLTLTACEPSSSDDSLDVEDVAIDHTSKAGDTSTGFVSNAPIKAAQQAVDVLEKQKLLQSSQASGDSAH